MKNYSATTAAYLAANQLGMYSIPDQTGQLRRILLTEKQVKQLKAKGKKVV